MATPVQMHKWPLCAFYGADLGPGTHEAEEGRENMHENNASEQFFYLQGVLSTSDIDGDRRITLEQCELMFQQSTINMMKNFRQGGPVIGIGWKSGTRKMGTK